MRRGELDPVAREPQRRFHEPGPRQPPVLGVQRAEPGRQPGHAARGDSDRVVDELGAERDLELDKLGPPSGLSAEPGHRDEAVEIAGLARGGVVVDRVTAS